MKKKFEKTKNKNGITLITLVITIIVIIIIAGVAISLLRGENSIFGAAKDSGDKYTAGAEEEYEAITGMEVKLALADDSNVIIKR